MKVYIGRYTDGKEPRKIDIRIDKWDTWGMDHTLALIILPMLKQLRDTKHGSSGRMPGFQQTSNLGQSSFPFYAEGDDAAWEAGHKQWDEIMEKMIWSFEQVLDDNWEDQYWIEKPKIDWEAMNNDAVSQELVWKKRGVCDWDAREKHQERINEGLRLFGEYYEDLWD